MMAVLAEPLLYVYVSAADSPCFKHCVSERGDFARVAFI